MEIQRKMRMAWRWSAVTATVIALFWAVWYWVAGSVPVTTSIKIIEAWTINLGFGISRWWDILIGPIWSTIIILFFTSEKIKEIEENKDSSFDLSTGLVIGLFTGLGASLVIGMVFGAGSGLGEGLGVCLGIALGISLSALGVDLDCCLSTGLIASLVTGLIASLILGLVTGLIFGVGFFLVISPLLIAKLIAIIFSPKSSSVIKNWLLAKQS